MKLQLIGHDERYVVEQSLMALFPGELPEYSPVTPEDTAWAVITLEQAEERCQVIVELAYQGRKAAQCVAFTPDGTEFDREGQRRHAIGRCFFPGGPGGAGHGAALGHAHRRPARQAGDLGAGGGENGAAGPADDGRGVLCGTGPGRAGGGDR